uniref:Putative disease resistance protein At1g61310 n=1 Tax=Anthurium amnicola TaxID=1678845 RepID=A0A1D1XPJ5_9ARAE
MPIIIPCFTCFGDQDPVRDALAGTLQSKVGELVSVLWDWTLGWPTNLILLSQNAELLDKEMEELKEMRNDMKRRVECEEAQPSMERMDQVEGWMARVGELDVQVSGFRAARERQSIWITGFCLGRTATEQLKRVRQLTSQLGNLNTVVGTAAPDADVLGEEMKELRILRDDLMRSVRIKEADPQMKRTHLEKEWVEMVDALDAEVVEFLRSQSPGYTEVAKKLRQVRKLKSQGNFDGKEVVTQVPPDAVEAVPSKPVSSIVGGEETLSEIRGHLRNEQVGIIGVYGMGGVGKTTILKQINNELCAAGTHGGLFDVVIMITVSRVQNKLAIQKDIGERIGLTLAEDDGGAGNSSRLVEHQARTLFKALSRKRFLLLLDDVWEQLVNMCKVVFTTRSEEVCIDMGAHEKVQVNLLSEGQSWELFRRTVRANAILDNPSIRPLAEKAVTQCGGLPLALITVGRAMANKKLPQEWSAAVKALQDNAQELRGSNSWSIGLAKGL